MPNDPNMQGQRNNSRLLFIFLIAAAVLYLPLARNLFSCGNLEKVATGSYDCGLIFNIVYRGINSAVQNPSTLLTAFILLPIFCILTTVVLFFLGAILISVFKR